MSDSNQPMRIWARIDHGTVVEMFEAARIDGMFHPSLTWIDITDSAPRPQIGWTYAGGSFAAPAPQADTMRARQLATLTAACEQQISSGFISAATGRQRFYPTGLLDQMNLLSAVAAAAGADATWSALLWCAEAGSWTLLPHDAAAVRRVNADWIAHRQHLQQQLVGVSAAVRAADSVAAVQAITWPPAA